MTGPRLTGATFRAAIASLAAVSVAAFAWLTLATSDGERFALDGRLFDAIAAAENGAFEAAMVLLTFLGAGAGLMLVLAGVVVALLRQGRRADVVFTIGCLAAAQVAGRIVKAAVDKPRPQAVDTELVRALSDLRPIALVIAAVLVLVAVATRRWRPHALAFAGSYLVLVALFELALPAIVGSREGVAFPSGHATSSATVVLAAVVVLAWPARRRWTWLAVATAFSVGVGVSRVAFGLHQPSDVLGGWLLAVAVVSTAHTGVIVARRHRSVRPASGARRVAVGRSRSV